MLRRLPQKIYLATIALGLAMSVGCSDDSGKTKLSGASVTGSVRFKDEPLGGGTIRIVSMSDENKSNSTLINPDGTFTMPNAPVGECRVLVETESAKLDVSAFLKNLPPDAKIDRSKIPPSMKYVPINRLYCDPKESPLRVTIKPGNQKVEVVIPE